MSTREAARRVPWPALVFVLLGACPRTEPPVTDPPFQHPDDDAFSLFHLQALATHNSYHVQGDVDLLAWNYTHLPLDQQAALLGVRGFELDLYWRPDAGLLEVVHVPLVDPVSNCPDLPTCLATLRRWSREHPAHHPFLLQFEGKGGVTEQNVDGFIAAVEAALRDAWGTDGIITPDEVQGSASSLAEAVRTRGWPLLGATRGRAVFAWDDRGVTRRAYSRDGGSLGGRLMFIDGDPGEPLAAFTVANDPAPDAPIRAALAAGMLVRTRADSDSVEWEARDTSRLQAALASGAHFISTDYPGVDGGSPGAYVASMPGGTPSRCNPVTTLDAGRPCASGSIEDPRALR